MNCRSATGTVFALAAMLAACDRVPTEAGADDKSAQARPRAREKGARAREVADGGARRGDLEEITAVA